MLVGAHSQIVRHPLTYALGVIVVDVGRERADHRNQDCAEGRDGCDFHLAGAEPTGRRRDKVIEPARKMMRSDYIIESDFHRPRAGETHQRLEHHGDQYDEKGSPIRPNQLANQAQHVASLMAIGRACKFGHLPWWAWLICFRSMLPESGAETHPTSVASERSEE